MKKAVFIIIGLLILASCTNQEITGRVVGVQQVQDRLVTSNPVNIQVNPVDDGPPPGTPIVENMAALKALSPGQHSQVWLEGYYTPQDGGQGLFQWDQTSTQNDNAGTIIIPDSNPSQGRWIRDTSIFNYYNVRWFGARGDDLDSSASANNIAFENALQVAAGSNNKNVYLPPGIYKISNRIYINENHYGVKLFGQLNYKYITYSEAREMFTTIPDEWYYWSDFNEFRVVDESSSSVVKRVDNLNIWSGSFHLIIVGHAGGDRKVNFVLKDVAVNGNRKPHENQNSFYHNVYDRAYDNAEYLLFDNVASYFANRMTFSQDTDGAIYRNCLAYYWGWGSHHGFAGRGGTEEKPIVFEGVNEAHFGHGGFGFDFSGSVRDGVPTGYWVGDKLLSHHNWQGMKTTPNTKLVDFKELEVHHSWTSGLNHIGNFDRNDPLRAGGHQRWGKIHAWRNGGLGVSLREGLSNKIGVLVADDNMIKASGDSTSYHINVQNAEVGQLISRNYQAGGTARAFSSGGNTISNVLVHDNSDTGILTRSVENIKSGRIYDNGGTPILLASTSGVLTIGNVEFKNNGPGRTINNHGTVKYTNLVDGDGNPISPEGPGNHIRLPESEITGSVVSGSSVTLTFSGSTNEPGRSISSIRLYRYVPGSENPVNEIEDVEIGTFSGPYPQTHTVSGLPTGQHRFYTIAVDSEGDHGIEPLDFDGNMQGRLVTIS